MVKMAHCFNFKSFRINDLRKHSLKDVKMVMNADWPFFVINGLKELKQNRCELPHNLSYEKDRKFLYINHLHNNRHE